MSNYKFNCNKKVKKPFHEFQYPAGEYCNLLLDDFFNYVERKFDKIKIIKAFDKPKDMDVKKMSYFLALCQIEWDRYCFGHSLPGESSKLLKSKLIEQWAKMGKRNLALNVSSRSNVN